MNVTTSNSVQQRKPSKGGLRTSDMASRPGNIPEMYILSPYPRPEESKLWVRVWICVSTNPLGDSGACSSLRTLSYHLGKNEVRYLPYTNTCGGFLSWVCYTFNPFISLEFIMWDEDLLIEASLFSLERVSPSGWTYLFPLLVFQTWLLSFRFSRQTL